PRYVVAALVCGLHRLRVGVGAWASAMPYGLALLFALLSTLTCLRGPRTPWTLGLSLALCALSLLARPVALGLPAALFALDWWIARKKGVWRILPFAVLAVIAAYVESTAR